MNMYAIILIVAITIMSLITYLLYASDKHKAINREKRTPERTLLSFSILGGAIGGFLAMQITRHKTSREHWYFTAVNVSFMILHILIVVLVAVLI